jgi:hypothetical protein
MKELIEVIEQNLSECPKAVINAYMREIGADKMCGYCDVNGEVDPTCVWDETSDDDVNDCVYASDGVKKKECSHWIKNECKQPCKG